MFPESTLRCIHDITGEEAWPETRFGRAIHRLQANLDWTLWVRRVDIALIGGDPVTLSVRLETLARQSDYRDPLKLALLHPGSFSGAPLALLSEPDVRHSLALSDPPDHATDPARATITAMIERMTPFLKARAGTGVRAFDMVQGCEDPERGETVLRLTRARERPRLPGRALSDEPRPQIRSSETPLGGELYARSAQLFDEGLADMWRRLPGSFREPPSGCRYADVVVARRVEILSGFISPPAVSREARRKCAPSMPYRLARGVPSCVEDALEMWTHDLALARGGPIFA